MKKVLIIYYSQTGQLTEIVHSVTTSLKNNDEFVLSFEELKPQTPYPFPWTGKQFFQAFPESVREIPCKLKPLRCNPDESYDLIILAYQIWYLSPSIPVNSFLQSEEARRILDGKPVVTIIGSRNMWVMAHENVKQKIINSGGHHVGNIVLLDKAPNLISVITIIRWLINGKRESKGFIGKLFPRAGVSEKDVLESFKYGEILADSCKENDYSETQNKLVISGAVIINTALMSIEKRGYMMFKIWAKFILKKGTYGDPRREPRLSCFKYYLFTVIFLVSPIASGIFYLAHLINRKNRRKLIRYYSDITAVTE